MLRDKNGDILHVGDMVTLLEKPCGYVTRYCKLTVGNRYVVKDFEGSNVITTTDEPDGKASYNRQRVERVVTIQLKYLRAGDLFLLPNEKDVFKFVIVDNRLGTTAALIAPKDRPNEFRWHDSNAVVVIHYPD